MQSEPVPGPRDDAASCEIEPSAPEADAQPCHRVLVVDDEFIIREVIAESLDACGRFEVEQRGDGHQALQRLVHGEIDLLVTDLNMPGLDGHALIGELAKWPPRDRPAIIIVSAWLSQTTEDAFQDGMVHAALPKPFKSEALIQACCRAVAQRTGEASSPGEGSSSARSEAH